jgi:hypothetical protein
VRVREGTAINSDYLPSECASFSEQAEVVPKVFTLLFRCERGDDLYEVTPAAADRRNSSLRPRPIAPKRGSGRIWRRDSARKSEPSYGSHDQFKSAVTFDCARSRPFADHRGRRASALTPVFFRSFMRRGCNDSTLGLIPSGHRLPRRRRSK